METKDEDLMEMYAGGDVSAFQELFSRHEKKLYNFFLRRLGDPEKAADLFQELFLRLHRNRGRFDSRQSFATWFYTIANNLVIDELRLRRGIQFEAVQEEEHLPESTLPTPEESMAFTEIKKRIESAIEILPESQKEVLVLARFEGLNHSEIAQIAGKSKIAVRQLLYRALQNLRKQLRDP